MIEGINSSLASTQVSRATTATVSEAPTFTVDPVSTGNAASKTAGFISPNVVVDSSAAIRAILQFRDTTSGEVLRQFPTESQLQAYSKTQAALLASQNSAAQLAVNQEAAAQEAVARVAELQQPTQPAVESKPVEAAQAPEIAQTSNTSASTGESTNIDA